MSSRTAVLQRQSAAAGLNSVPAANGDAGRVSARGKGLTEATANQQTSFTVDTSLAGRLSDSRMNIEQCSAVAVLSDQSTDCMVSGDYIF